MAGHKVKWNIFLKNNIGVIPLTLHMKKIFWAKNTSFRNVLSLPPLPMSFIYKDLSFPTRIRWEYSSVHRNITMKREKHWKIWKRCATNNFVRTLLSFIQSLVPRYASVYCINFILYWAFTIGMAAQDQKCDLYLQPTMESITIPIDPTIRER
mgnify:CR=1 FL=1